MRKTLGRALELWYPDWSYLVAVRLNRGSPMEVAARSSCRRGRIAKLPKQSMLIPQTYAGALILIVLSMICWGSWANTFKLSGKWRFELFYYDYSLGVLLAALIAAYTFGSMGDDRSFSANLIRA